MRQWIHRRREHARKGVPVEKSVLVVEDDEGLLEVLHELLEMEGYSVTLAHNGVEALAALKTLTPAVVLLDLRMPRMDGEAFARAAHRRRRLRSLNIIVMTANLYARQTAEAMGASDFVAKPFDVNELLTKIDQVTEATEDEAPHSPTDVSAERR